MKIVINLLKKDLEQSGLSDFVQKLNASGVVIVTEKRSQVGIAINVQPWHHRRRVKKEVTDITTTADSGKTYLVPQVGSFDSSVALVEEKAIAEVINRFKPVNPDYDSHFSRKASREAARSMLEKYNTSYLFKIIDNLPVTNGLPYAPIATNPIELRNRLPKLIAFIHKKIAEEGSNGGFSVSL